LFIDKEDTQMTNLQGLLILPRLRIQNANAISSPLTWGFPSITAFFGFMWNLERKLAEIYVQTADTWYADVNEPRHDRLPMHFAGIGIVCHSFEPQMSTSGYTRTFHLTRNPLDKDGTTKSIAQEGRAHLELTIILSVRGEILTQTEETRQKISCLVMRLAESMRVAGGTVVPNLTPRIRRSPALFVEDIDPEQCARAFTRLKRSWLPGSALVLRDDLLQKTHHDLTSINPDSTLVDAWLHDSRLNYRAFKVSKEVEGKASEQVEWRREKKVRCIVPIPVGYCALSELYENEQVKNSRDDATPFRFVESIYSLGEWVGAHRLENVQQILWYPTTVRDTGIYRCNNNYANQVSDFHD